MTYRRCVLAVAFLTAFVTSAARPADGAPPKRPAPALFGVAVNIPEGAGSEAIGREVVAVRQAGAGLMCVSKKWSEIERAGSVPQLDDLVGGMQYMDRLGFRVALTLQILDTNNRTLPSDLQGEPFSSPVLRARLAALLRALLPRLPRAVRWIMLGNEVDAYLQEHPSEVAAYAELIEQSRETIRKVRPGTLVGVTTMYGGLTTNRALVERLNRNMDVYTATYYPLDARFHVRPPSTVAPDLEKMVKFAGKRPLLLQEAGYPASTLLDSSESKQAAFVDALFAAAGRHPGRIAGVDVFLLYDFTRAQVDTFTRYYGIGNTEFREYLGTLGLRRADGKPRAADARFRARLKGWTKSR